MFWLAASPWFPGVWQQEHKIGATKKPDACPETLDIKQCPVPQLRDKACSAGLTVPARTGTKKLSVSLQEPVGCARTPTHTLSLSQGQLREGGALHLSPSGEKQHRACSKSRACPQGSELGGAVEAALGPHAAWNPKPCYTDAWQPSPTSLGRNLPMRP